MYLDDYIYNEIYKLRILYIQRSDGDIVCGGECGAGWLLTSANSMLLLKKYLFCFSILFAKQKAIVFIV